MLLAGSALKGYAIEASDGAIGSVSDFLFDDRSWKIRWMVVDTGKWLSGRKVLIHPSAIGQPDFERRTLPVNLTKAKVEASPDIMRDQPVSARMENNLYGYYGWDSMWGGPGYFGGAPLMMAPGWAPSSYIGETAAPGHDRERDDGVFTEAEGDPHLRAMAEIAGYHVHATDGVIGHVENFLIDDSSWGIRYLIIDTRNWWFGEHVLISPYAVRGVSWSDHEIKLDVGRARVKSSPPWNPVEQIDQAYEKSLHNYYNWPGYGW
jgi:hypothetical protein